MRVLVVDDERAVRAAVRRGLALDGWQVVEAGSGSEALEVLQESAVDAMVLDLAMPEPDGLEVCRRLHEAGDRTPTLILTARTEVSDRVAGLDAGADDYLVKPFALAELKARLRALLRRSEAAGDRGLLRFGPITCDPKAYEVRVGNRPVELTRTEFSLLELFLLHPRQVLSRPLINERIWGYDFGATSNSLGVYIGYLRRKLEAGGEPRMIHTVRGVGYILRELREGER
jgi:two-component system, OmpR family, response regulator MprA